MLLRFLSINISTEMSSKHRQAAAAEQSVAHEGAVNHVDGVIWQGDNTPLHWASMRGHVEIVRLLCERSADRSIRNKQDKVQALLGTPCGHPYRCAMLSWM
jgi:ankyrin repeat protein